YGFVALLTLRPVIALRRPARTAIAPAAMAIAMVGFPFGRMTGEYFGRAAEPYTRDGSRIVASVEGSNETIFLMRQSWLDRPGYHGLVTTGFSMSGPAVAARRYMRTFVYLPMLLHTTPLKRALVVCYGVGITAGAAVDVPSLDTIDVVEISKDVVSMSDVIY